MTIIVVKICYNYAVFLIFGKAFDFKYYVKTSKIRNSNSASFQNQEITLAIYF